MFKRLFIKVLVSLFWKDEPEINIRVVEKPEQAVEERSTNLL